MPLTPLPARGESNRGFLAIFPTKACQVQDEDTGNVPAENFFNSLKNERVHGTRYATLAEGIANLFDYIEPLHNHSRRH